MPAPADLSEVRTGRIDPGDPAFPVSEKTTDGLTIRAYIAARVLPEFVQDHGARDAADRAVEYADALIRRLNEG